MVWSVGLHLGTRFRVQSWQSGDATMVTHLARHVASASSYLRCLPYTSAFPSIRVPRQETNMKSRSRPSHLFAHRFEIHLEV